MNICITGTSRGIGKRLAELFSHNEKNIVFAGARQPVLQDKNNLFSFVQDLSNPQEAARALTKKLDELEKLEIQNKKIDILIFNAGIFPNKDEDDLHTVEAKIISETVFINAASAIEITKHLLRDHLINKHAKIVGISSIYGSFSNANMAKHYSYAMSKAAMNMGFHIMANELRRHQIGCFVISPGWVQTDMGGKNAPLSLDKSCPLIVESILNWNLGDNLFINYDGKPLAW